MSKKRVLLENDCDYSIQTYVNLGKTIKDVPQGWALNLMDIREFIPGLRFELEGFIVIRNIISPCRIRINPRLFYSGVNIKHYLRSQKSADEDRKILIEIKFNKEKLGQALDEFERDNFNYIDTKLLVGKSYSSKGWGLKKEVVSKIVPLDAYNFMYPVFIDGIPAETRLNMQTRLFYSSNELSKELERLSEIDPKQEVDARIILNEEYLRMIKTLEEDRTSDSKCIICGQPLDRDSKGNKCYVCLDKELTVLKLKKILEFFSPSETVYEENLLDLGYSKGKIRIIFSKLKKYDLVLENWDGSFELMDENTISNFINEWG